MEKTIKRVEKVKKKSEEVYTKEGKTETEEAGLMHLLQKKFQRNLKSYVRHLTILNEPAVCNEIL